jgi:hypothetical protein
MLEDMVMAVHLQRLAVNRLLGAGLKPSASQCREGLRRLRSLEQQLEPLEPFLRREYVYQHHKYGWTGLWYEAVESWSQLDHKRRWAVQLRATTQAWLRVLTCELAVQAYLADHQRLPTSLDELVPEYWDVVPQGPFGGEPIRFLKESTRYSIWTSDGGNEIDGLASPFPAPKVVRPTGP